MKYPKQTELLPNQRTITGTQLLEEYGPRQAAGELWISMMEFKGNGRYVITLSPPVVMEKPKTVDEAFEELFQ